MNVSDNLTSLDLGPVRISFHRTVRVREDQKSGLPPSLGHFQLYKVADYKDACPSGWDEKGYFLAMHDKEAMWLNFSAQRHPVALLIGAGGVNAVNGKKLGLKLEEENYVVTPPQPWLDGWKGEDGTVYQFVTTTYEKGEGLTVGEQMHGAESKTGGLGIAVFEAEKPEETFQRPTPTPDHYGYGGDCLYAESMPVAFSMAATRGAGRATEMGVGKGGKIDQKLYPDPYGISVWKGEPSAFTAVYLVDAVTFTQITGLPMPPLPKVFDDYYGPWFKVQDKHLADQKGSDKFDSLKMATGKPASEVFPADEANPGPEKNGN
jgi:hypothetical protein